MSGRFLTALLLSLAASVVADPLAPSWRSRAQAFDDLVFSREAGPGRPLAASLDPALFKLPTYAGGPASGEGICVLGFLLSADLMGDARVRPLLPAALRWSPAEGVPSNYPGGRESPSYWYELFPALLLTQIALRHPEDQAMDANLTRMADRYAGIIRALGGPTADFAQTGFLTRGPKPGPVVNGRWTEPDAAAAMAYVCYAAWRRHRQPAHLEAARWAMDSLERRQPSEGSPLYEVCLYCAPALAARMNHEIGSRYDVSKLLGWCLATDEQAGARPGWGRLDRDFGTVPAKGLCGDTRPGKAYAFAMNSFVAASMIAPLVAEEPRYAPIVGPWLADVSRNARSFFADVASVDGQSSPEWRKTPLAAIPYEGLREKKRQQTRTQADGPGLWRAELPDARGDFEWRAELPAAIGTMLRVVITDAEGHEAYVGNYRLKAGQTSVGGLVAATRAPLRLAFAVDGKPAELKALRVIHQATEGPWLTGDAVIFGWGPSTDLAVYAGAHLGSFAVLTQETGVPGLLCFDLSATDHLGHDQRPRRLLMNASDHGLTFEGLRLEAGGTAVR
jgi:hypothetical protein